jgi:hypothetical protein
MARDSAGRPGTAEPAEHLPGMSYPRSSRWRVALPGHAGTIKNRDWLPSTKDLLHVSNEVLATTRRIRIAGLVITICMRRRLYTNAACKEYCHR